jgi:hypothetical protein
MKSSSERNLFVQIFDEHFLEPLPAFGLKRKWISLWVLTSVRLILAHLHLMGKL